MSAGKKVAIYLRGVLTLSLASSIVLHHLLHLLSHAHNTHL